MYYVEEMIDGIMHYRSSPYGPWHVMSLKSLSAKLDNYKKAARSAEKKLSEENDDHRFVNAWIREAICPLCGEVTTEETLHSQVLCEALEDSPIDTYGAEIHWRCDNCKGSWKEVHKFEMIIIDGRVTTVKELK